MPTNSECILITNTIQLLKELFRTNNIDANVSGAAMDTYLWLMLEDSIKMGDLTPKDAEHILSSGYLAKIHLLRLLEEKL
jgi:hypothetical protein